MCGLDRVLVSIGPNSREYVEKMMDVVQPIVVPTNVTVYLLRVFPRGEYEDLMSQMDVEPTTGNLQPDVLAERHEDLREPAEQLENRGVDTRIRGTIGDPTDEVIRVANDIQADLLFIGGAGRSPTGKAVFGDSAQQILLNAPCPVTYVRRD